VSLRFSLGPSALLVSINRCAQWRLSADLHIHEPNAGICTSWPRFATTKQLQPRLPGFAKVLIPFCCNSKSSSYFQFSQHTAPANIAVSWKHNLCPLATVFTCRLGRLRPNLSIGLLHHSRRPLLERSNRSAGLGYRLALGPRSFLKPSAFYSFLINLSQDCSNTVSRSGTVASCNLSLPAEACRTDTRHFSIPRYERSSTSGESIHFILQYIRLISLTACPCVRPLKTRTRHDLPPLL
jgi:hypothetical protein